MENGQELQYRIGGEILKGIVAGVCGAGLIVQTEAGGESGLQRSRLDFVMIHQAVSQQEWTRLYNQCGGEALFDEEGSPIG